jgi:hypothetical protein
MNIENRLCRQAIGGGRKVTDAEYLREGNRMGAHWREIIFGQTVCLEVLELYELCITCAVSMNRAFYTMEDQYIHDDRNASESVLRL